VTVWLGAPEPSWLGATDRDLCISHRRLSRLSTWALPFCPKGSRWMLDSGGFWVMHTYVRPDGIADDEVQVYPDSPEQYVRAVALYQARIGGLEWASIQDWMCEENALRATGLTVEQHQQRTVESWFTLTALWHAHRPQLPSPFRKAIQGDTPESYVRCMRMYADRGAPITTDELVGLGSVCRRSRTKEIAAVVQAVHAERPGIQLHGYGVKSAGLTLYGAGFASVDSMAHGDAARKRKLKSPRCTQFHPVCSYCLTWAEEWHDEVRAKFAAAHRTAAAPVPSPAPARRRPPQHRTPASSGQLALID
jgi:hypothetical protein